MVNLGFGKAPLYANLMIFDKYGSAYVHHPRSIEALGGHCKRDVRTYCLLDGKCTLTVGIRYTATGWLVAGHWLSDTQEPSTNLSKKLGYCGPTTKEHAQVAYAAEITLGNAQPSPIQSFHGKAQCHIQKKRCSYL